MQNEITGFIVIPWPGRPSPARASATGEERDMTEDTIRRQLADLRADETVNLAKGTRRVYGIMWTGFENWCDENGHRSLPASPLTVVGYLMHRFEDGLAPTTLKTARNAIASKHSLAGLPNPTASENVKTCLKLLRRKASKAGRGVAKQAPGIRLEHIKTLEGNVPLDEEIWGGTRWTDSDERRHRMDCAVISVMHCALLRSAEAAALTWGNIVFLANGRGRLTIQKSKTSDQPMTRLLTTRAVRHLRNILPADPSPEDRVFRVTTGRAIHNRIGRAMKHIRPGATGHSPRVGGAQDLTIRGASLQQVKEAGGWKNLAMPAQYASKVDAEVGGVLLLED